MKERILALKKNLPNYLELWKALCNMETPSSCREELNKQADFIESFALEQGFTVSRQSHTAAGDTLIVELVGDDSLAPIALLAHMDTVHEKGAFGYPPVKEKDGILYGPGVFDCKGGICVALLTMQVIAQTTEKHRTLRLILNSDEEDGRYLLDERAEFIQNAARGCCAAFNMEAGRADSLTVGRKGVLRAKLQIRGIAGHAGNNYFESASAVCEAAHKILELEAQSTQEGLTYNCGLISGGTAANIVPEICTIEVDIRYKNARQYEQALATLEQLSKSTYIKGCTTECKIISTLPAMECTDANLALFEKVMEASRALGMQELLPLQRGGGSDSAYTVAIGIPTVCSMGTVGRYEHTIREQADIDTLKSRALLLVESIIRV